MLRFVHIGHQGYWYDEANTVRLLHLSFGKMLGALPLTESTPPLYYGVAWVWTHVFGYGEGALRSLSAVFGIATVPVVFELGRITLSRRAGLIAAALVTCSPIAVWYSQEARSYELLVLLTAVVLLLAVRARDRPTVGRFMAWAVACCLAVLTHYFAVLVIAPTALWLLREYPRRPALYGALALIAACGGALVPLLVSQENTGHSAWIHSTALGLRLGQIPPQFLIGFGTPARTVLRWTAQITALVAIGMLLLRADRRTRRTGLVFGACALVGFLVMMLLLAVGSDDLITRNVIPLFVPLAMMLAAGLAVPRPRGLGGLAAALLCAIGLFVIGETAFNRALQRPDWRAVARVIGPAPVPPAAVRAPGAPAIAGLPARPGRRVYGARVVIIQHFYFELPLVLYEPGLSWMTRPVRAREIDIIGNHSIAAGVFCWWGAACNLPFTPLLARYPLAGFRPAWIRHTGQFDILRLIATRPRIVTRREIRVMMGPINRVWSTVVLTQR